MRGALPSLRRSLVWLFVMVHSALTAQFLSGTSNAERVGPLDDWTWRQPLPQGNNLLSIIWDGHQFVAVGRSGAIVTSSNGAEWIDRGLREPIDLFGIAFGANRYVALGRGPFIATSRGVIFTSSDAKTWRSQLSPDTHTVVYGEGLFVAGIRGLDGHPGIITSPDGEVWTERAFPRGDFYGVLAIAHRPGRFVAAGGRAVNVSSDGVSWTNVANGGVFNSALISSAVAGDDRFLLLGTLTNLASAWTSFDGKDWSKAPLGENRVINGGGFGAGKFIAVGVETRTNDSIARIWTLTEGTNWVQTGPPPPDRPSAALRMAAYGGGVFVVVGAHGNILTSQDAMAWRYRSSATSTNLRDAAWGNEMFVAVGNEGKVLTSPDAIQWREINSSVFPTNTNFRAAGFGGNRFVLVGDSSTLLSSTNGLDWRNSEISRQASFYGIGWNGSFFVAVGDDGVIFTSVNGVNWTNRVSHAPERLQGVAFGRDTWVATGRNGVVVTSTNGIDWTRHASGVVFYLQAAAFGNGVFVAAGGAGGVISTNGTRWSLIADPALAGVEKLLFADGVFLAVGNDGRLATSTDGLQWKARRTITDESLRGGTYGKGTFLVVGNNEIILQSAVFTPRLLGLTLPSAFQLQVQAEAGLVHQVQFSDDLQTWRPLGLITNSEPSATFSDEAASRNSRRFYRLRRVE